MDGGARILDFPSRTRWYVVSTLADYMAKHEIERLGISAWLPERLVERSHRGISGHEVRPLLPGYLFVNLSPGDPWQWINDLRPVNRVLTHFVAVGATERPTPVGVGQVERLQARLEMMGGIWIENAVERRRRFQKGDRLRISEDGGSWAGTVGTIEVVRSGGMIELAIDGFGGTVPLLVSEALVEPA